MANGLPAWPGGNKQTNVHNSIIAVPNGGSHIIGLFDIEKSAQPQFFGPMWVITHSPSTFRSSGVLTKIATHTHYIILLAARLRKSPSQLSQAWLASSSG